MAWAMRIARARASSGGSSAVIFVTHADGSHVEPVETDALLIGMGERYDV